MRPLTPANLFDLEATVLPVAFDIVWCRYPYRALGSGPGPVARPCLVRQAFVRPTVIKGEAHNVGYIAVVYGTKQIDKFPPPRGFHVEDDAEKQACGLIVDTVFDLQDSVILPWSPVYFARQNAPTPVGGHFTPAMQARLIAQVSSLTTSGAPSRLR